MAIKPTPIDYCTEEHKYNLEMSLTIFFTNNFALDTSDVIHIFEDQSPVEALGKGQPLGGQIDISIDHRGIK